MTPTQSPAGRLYVGLVVLAVLTPADPVRAQVNIEAYRDHFLVGRYGELCAVCEAVVVCRAGEKETRTPTQTARNKRGHARNSDHQ